MTPEIFDFMMDRRMRKTVDVMSSKASEYASDDRLHNFKMVAAADNTTPERALWGMYMKHFISVRDMVHGLKPVSREIIDEKIGDSINYHILLEAILTEKLVEGDEGTNEGK